MRRRAGKSRVTPASTARASSSTDPLHYLALIETKPGALDQAAALQDWDLPELTSSICAISWRRSMGSNRGKREFIQVLRLMEIGS